ncbi:MAG: ABC transporter permease [Candidatus Helarchaeota archaeon]|nr:ABC transporter permease [Candidatus Helarchaeota archaeon]
MIKKIGFRDLIIGSSGIFLFIILWETVSKFIIKNSFIMPSFSDVITSFLAISKYLPSDLSGSFLHFFTGLFIAILMGGLLGAIMGWFRTVDRFFRPVIELLRPIPPLAWIPFAIIWFRLTDLSASFIIFIGCFFPIFINTYLGFRNTPKIFTEAAMVLGHRSNIKLLYEIALPSSLLSVFYGIRIAIGIGWMCMIAAEIFGRTYGLGYRLWYFYQMHQMDFVVAYMFILGLIGILLEYSFRYLIEKKFVKWKQGLVIK